MAAEGSNGRIIHEHWRLLCTALVNYPLRSSRSSLSRSGRKRSSNPKWLRPARSGRNAMMVASFTRRI